MYKESRGCKKITEEDIVRVARRMLNARPAVAARGKLGSLPSYDDIQTAMAIDKADSAPQSKRFHLFRS
ncbi:Mitochondrial-processing peptidase subunit alpha [Eumeta japonica]|uniref:Mitochondrial-processing peptidase subunit alpha n=1 Tax=Eumeta variegata TaxID=151549 RepID=A0A4C1TD41_EUMVA|nr:Mitochondrial-processing peptidase subunit alpha [Eumeta japonica]